MVPTLSGVVFSVDTCDLGECFGEAYSKLASTALPTTKAVEAPVMPGSTDATVIKPH
jgi:hypothetical protein